MSIFKSPLAAAKLIVELLEGQEKREAMLATPAANDLIYHVPKCLCIKMVAGEPESAGAMFATPLPPGMTFQNGNGTKAVRAYRRDVLRAEMADAKACLKLMVDSLQPALEG